MSEDLDALKKTWAARWPEALALWSRFTRLGEPRWCLSERDERREELTGSFAMIRLTDHAVVVSLKGVKEHHLERYPLEIMAHEVGHHVLCPADLGDQARLIARLRRGLPGKEALAPFVANVYADLLINDRLQRSEQLRMADVYRTLSKTAAGDPDGDAGDEAAATGRRRGKRARGEPTATADKFWTFYMRTFEHLWGLPKGELAPGKIPPEMEADAQLGAKIVRVYARDWLKGAGRFACLCYPYLADEARETRRILRGWLDTETGAEGDIPDGLAEMDDDEIEGAIHPSLDPDLTDLDDGSVQKDDGRGREAVGGNRRRYREPGEYADVLKAAGVKLSESEIAMRFYRELAVPHLIRFPVREVVDSTDPLPEGLDVWDVGSPVEEIDWFETTAASPTIIPGVTTVQRVMGTSPGTAPEKEPVDLYLGIDCSGSMLNPRVSLSYPVLAGVVMALSALRAGARVMATLSGEPGRHVSTEEFVDDERKILGILTGYLGTGYAFGINRLADAYGEDVPARERKSHILVITDTDIFMMLDDKKLDGWVLAANALGKAGGGGTYVLHMPGDWKDARTARMESEGWSVHSVQSMEDLLSFAREFSRRQWERVATSAAGRPA